MRGKYSPTVTEAYRVDQNWWAKYTYASKEPTDDFIQYDPDGYDSYGYDKNDVDRAGNNESDYIPNDAFADGYDDDCNYAYDRAIEAWGFDGTKPVLRGVVWTN